MTGDRNGYASITGGVAELKHERMATFKQSLEQIVQLALERQAGLGSLPTIADDQSVIQGLRSLPRRLPPEGHEHGLEGSMKLLFEQVLPVLAQGQAGPRYYGFVTGGTLPSALLTDMVVSMLDANVQVHLPKETLSTVIEKYALDMVLDAMHMDRSQWTGTFTTGATTSNLLALSCARQATVQRACRIRKRRRRQAAADKSEPTARLYDYGQPDEDDQETDQVDGHDWDPAEDGLSGIDVPPVRVFVSQAHASVQKSAAILGIGRRNVIDLGRPYEKTQTSTKLAHSINQSSLDEEDEEQFEALLRAETLDFDLAKLEEALKECNDRAEAAIVVVGMGEVVTGALTDQTLAIRLMCDKYGAWLHMDAAFAAFVCLHDEYHWVSTHMGVCDSLTSDAHKTLNVPYDCGILFVKKHTSLRESTLFIPPDESQTFSHHESFMDDVCGPSPYGLSAASYLNASRMALGEKPSDAEILAATLPSPLHRNLENSRRFRALPVYISLLSQGHRGTREMVERQLAFADRVRQWLRSSKYYQVLTPATSALSARDPTNGRMRAAPGEKNPPRWEHDYWATTVVLFRAHPQECPVAAFRDAKQGHVRLIDAIKQNRRIYVSPGGYCGLGAVRLAVSNWFTGVDGDRDFDITTQALSEVMETGAVQ